MWGESFYATVALLLFAMVLPTLGLWWGTSVLSKVSKASCKLLRLLFSLLKFLLTQISFPEFISCSSPDLPHPRLLPRYFHADVEADEGDTQHISASLSILTSKLFTFRATLRADLKTNFAPRTLNSCILRSSIHFFTLCQSTRPCTSFLVPRVPLHPLQAEPLESKNDEESL